MRKWCHSTGKDYSLVLIHPVSSNFGPLWIFCRLTTVNPNHSIYESCIGYYYCKNCVVRYDSCESITHLTPSCKKFKKDGKMMSVRPTFIFFVKSKPCCHKLILHGSWEEQNFSTCISARFEFTVGSLFYIHLYLSNTCGY